MAKKKVFHFKDGGTLVFKKQKINKAVEAQIYVSPGSRIDEIDGLSHFYEHMLFNGTATRSREELMELGRIHNAEQNAFTSNQYVALVFHCPASEFEPIIKYNSEMLLDSVFNEKNIENEKKVITEEILRSEDNNNRTLIISHKNTTVGFKKTNLTPLGTTETISTITQEDLKNYQEKWINKNNFLAVISGNISFRRVKKLVKKHFLNKMPKGQAQDLYDPSDETLLPNSNLSVVNKDIKQVNYHLSFPTFGVLCEDKIKIVSNFLINILNNQGIVIRKLRHENGLVYSSGVNTSKYKNVGLFSFEISTSKENLLKSFEVIGEIVKELLSNGISKEDLEYVKKSAKLKESKDAPILKGSCDKLYFQYKYNIPTRKKSYYKKIQKSITLQDMNNYIQNLFKPTKVFLTVLGNITQEEVPSIEYFEKLFDVK